MEKPNIVIRRANSNDADLLAELGARTFEDTFGADNTREDMAAYLATAFNPTQLGVEMESQPVTRSCTLVIMTDRSSWYVCMSQASGSVGVLAKR
jgi:phosphoserine aminotransferase